MRDHCVISHVRLKYSHGSEETRLEALTLGGHAAYGSMPRGFDVTGHGERATGSEGSLPHRPAARPARAAEHESRHSARNPVLSEAIRSIGTVEDQDVICSGGVGHLSRGVINADLFRRAQARET